MNRNTRLRKTSTLRRVTTKRRGVAVVEFAVVAPVLFLTIFGMFEMARMVMVKQAVVNAAREGCREACLATTTSAVDADTVVRTHLQNVVPDSSNPAKLRVTCTPASLSAITSGTSVSVNVECDFSDVSWMPGNFLGLLGTVEIRGTSVKVRE